MFEIAPHTRLRKSPYFDATVKAGVRGFTPYNQMLLPLGYGDMDSEYWQLINGVQLWDVAGERQIQLKGKDAARLAQILSTRDLTKCKVEQGKYVAICNHRGTIINDPILLKIDDDCYWLSIADSNILFWARAIAAERGLQVSITEADVAPLAVQGPQAENVVAAIFGDWVREIKHFWFRDAQLEGLKLKVARSGWSLQGGFEIYLLDSSVGDNGTKLWNIVSEAGKKWDIGPGYPNPNERIESGLLSCGGDSDDNTNPFEVRMGSYVDLDIPDDVVGVQALRKAHAEGIKRHQIGLILEGDQPKPGHDQWYDVYAGDGKVGIMTNGVWSRRLKKNIGFGLVSRNVNIGDTVQVHKNGETLSASVVNLPFV